MAIQGTDLADVVATTQNQLGKLKFTDIMSSYQNTIALKRLIKKGKITFDGGPEVQFNLITDTNDSFRFTGLYNQDIVDENNVMTNGKVPWRHATWNWAIDDRELAMNGGIGKIVDLVQTKRIKSFGSAVIGMERAFWRVPAASDTTTAYGIPYYVVKSNTAVTTNDGFNGDLPSGYSTVANLSTTTYPRWKNYATQYTAVTKDDLVRKWRRMAHYTDFMPLVDNIPQYDTGEDYGYYTNYSVQGTLVELLEAQNENLGNDLAPKDGSCVFMRTPVTWVKELDLDTTNPVYSINWGVMKTMGLRDKWMRETVIPHQAGQHNVSATFTDCSYNLLCYDRRKLGVLATNTTMGY